MLAHWRTSALLRAAAECGAHGAQVLGLTSYSHWPEAVALRKCAHTSASARETLQAVARERLESMLHVGLMEELHLSVASLAVGGGSATALCSASVLILSCPAHTVGGSIW